MPDLTVEVIQKLEKMSEPKVIEVDGVSFTKDELKPVVYSPHPDTVELNSIEGFVQFIESKLYMENHSFITVDSFNQVTLHSELDIITRKRKPILKAKCIDRSSFQFGLFQPLDSFNIGILSKFEDTPERARLLAYTGNIQKDESVSSTDDGIGQSVSVKRGITTIEKTVVKNPFKLKPFRTFTEVEQPESLFILRIDKDFTLALFESDGAMWKITAMKNIKKYLSERIKEIPVLV